MYGTILSEKARLHITALLCAAKLKNEPKKMVEYIRANKQYFPKFKEEELQQVLDEVNSKEND